MRRARSATSDRSGPFAFLQRTARWFVAGLVLPVLLSCASDEPAPRFPQPRLVLLYATCTLNKDYLAPYQPSVSFTPFLEAFSERALTFPDHYAESGQSGVSFAALFSGTQGMHHGVYRHPTRLADEVHLIAESFAAAGYDTFSWLGHPMASAALQYGQGVDPERQFERLLTANDPAFENILARLESDPDYRVFIVTNFTVTHGPYAPAALPAFCRTYPALCERIEGISNRQILVRQYQRAHLRFSFDFAETVRSLRMDEARVAQLEDLIETLYQANVHRLDRLFESLVSRIEARGLLQESLIALTADHGEVLLRENAHFRFTHGFQLAHEVLEVPMMLFGPSVGVQPGVFGGVTRSIDVFPTLAGLSAVPVPPVPGLGADLTEAVRGEAAAPALLAFSHTALFTDTVWKRYQRYGALRALIPSQDASFMWVAVRDRDAWHKLRYLDGEWRRSVFHHEDAARESNDLFDAEDEHHAALTQALLDYKRTLLEARGGPGAEPEVGLESQIELLRSLGYIE